MTPICTGSPIYTPINEQAKKSSPPLFITISASQSPTVSVGLHVLFNRDKHGNGRSCVYFFLPFAFEAGVADEAREVAAEAVLLFEAPRPVALTALTSLFCAFVSF